MARYPHLVTSGPHPVRKPFANPEAPPYTSRVSTAPHRPVPRRPLPAPNLAGGGSRTPPPAPNVRSALLRFGPFTVDLPGHCLLREGTRVPLQEQPFQILLALLDAPGNLVSRDTLRRRLWGAETFVDFDQSLNSAIRRLRACLGDNPKAPTYIETLPRIGFRFLAEVTVAEIAHLHVPPVSPPPRPQTGAEASFQASPEPVPSDIAAMIAPPGTGPSPASAPAPINPSPPPPLSALAAGTEHHLGWRIAASVALCLVAGFVLGLLLHSRTSGRLAGSRLGAGQASIPNHATLAAPALSGDRSPFLLTSASAPSLDEAQPRPATRGIPPITEPLSPSANPHLVELTGWYHLSLRSAIGYSLAQRAFEQALAADPRSASALVGLAESQILIALNGDATADRLEIAGRAADRAVHLAPNLAEAHTVAAAVRALAQWDEPAAEREFHAALRLDPHDSLAHLWLAMFVLVPEHRYPEAEAQAQTALADTPLSLIAHTDLGWILANQGKRDAALDQYRFVLTINPGFIPARFRMEQLLRSEGHSLEAAAFHPSDPSGPPDSLSLRHPTAPAAAASAPSPCRQATLDLSSTPPNPLPILRAAVQHRCAEFFFFGQDPTFAPLHTTPAFATLEQTAFLIPR